MKLKVSRTSVVFYMIITFILLAILSLFQRQEMRGIQFQSGLEKRVIKCEVPLPNKLVQNLYFMASDLQTAKQMLFNSKQGLFFDNRLYIKTADFNGQTHVVPFEQVDCDSVGQQVTSL